MSDFSAHKALEEAEERGEHGHHPWISIAAALFAVLAAVATMLAHSRSTTALVEKNTVILDQAKASDSWNQYESKRIKYYVYQAWIDVRFGDAATQKRLVAVAKREKHAALDPKARALKFEELSEQAGERAERALKAYETLEIAVTLFEISIVFISISAVTKNRMLVYLAGAAAAGGAVFLIQGILYHL